MKLLVLNGPNINMLGLREVNIYGKEDYQYLKDLILKEAKNRNVEVELYQSNHEGDLVDKIQEAYFKQIDGIIFNPAAYTHTSIALLDALKAVKIPCVEVHISNVKEREDFRQISYIRSACIKTIQGEGLNGYIMAMDYLIKYLNERDN